MEVVWCEDDAAGTAVRDSCSLNVFHAWRSEQAALGSREREREGATDREIRHGQRTAAARAYRHTLTLTIKLPTIKHGQASGVDLKKHFPPKKCTAIHLHMVPSV